MRILLVAVLVSCGGGAANDLDCAYLTSEENCFKVTASSAVSCLPPSDAIGVLAADNASCTYASGQVITFTPPLVLPLDFDAPWNFTVVTNGVPCLAYSDDEGGFELTVGDDTVIETLGGQGLSLTCPDGTQFSNSNALSLLSCSESFGDLPGNTSSGGDTSVSFGLLNAGTESTLSVFNCQR